MSWRFPDEFFDLEARGHYHCNCRLVEIQDGIVTFDCDERLNTRIRVQVPLEAVEAIYARPPMPEAERISYRM